MQYSVAKVRLFGEEEEGGELEGREHMWEKLKREDERWEMAT